MEQLVSMCVQIVVSIFVVLHDSRTIRLEVVLCAVLEVRPDCVNATGKLPCFEHLRHLHFAASALGDLLAPSTYCDRHGELIFFLSSNYIGCSNRGRRGFRAKALAAQGLSLFFGGVRPTWPATLTTGGRGRTGAGVVALGDLGGKAAGASDLVGELWRARLVVE